MSRRAKKKRGRMGRRWGRLPVLLLVALALGLAALVIGAAGSDQGPAGGIGPAPAPEEPLPDDPQRLADRLAQVSGALERSIDEWSSQGGPTTAQPPATLTLQALYQQRVYRLLARRPRLAALTFRRLPPSHVPMARDTTAALGSLFRLTTPTGDRRFRTQRPLPAGVLRSYYQRAERRFGVSWEVLAAVNFVESAFGRLKNDSVAGAQGPMQFIPATWRAYGMGGDVHNPRDAILGAANYLRRSGAPRNYRRALFAYNPSRLYVHAVLRYARQIEKSRHAYLAYYSWEVFVRTRSGDRRITGPGVPHGG